MLCSLGEAMSILDELFIDSCSTDLVDAYPWFCIAVTKTQVAWGWLAPPAPM